MRPKSPCKDCIARHEGCHSICVKYNDWKSEWEEQQKQINDGRCRYAELRRMRNESIERMKRRNHA